jgi:hypothetical protein
MLDTLAMITAARKEPTVLNTQLVTAKEQLESLIYHGNDYDNTISQIWREKCEAQAHHIELLRPSAMKKLHARGAGDLIKKHLTEVREQAVKKMTEMNDAIRKLDNEFSNQYTQIEEIEKKLSDLAAKIKLGQGRIELFRPRPTMKPK